MINGFVKCESCKHMIMLSEEQVDPGITETEEEDLGYIPTPKEVGLRGISSVNEYHHPLKILICTFRV